MRVEILYGCQKGDRSHIPGNIQGQDDLVEAVLTHCRGGWTRSFPNQAVLLFYEFKKRQESTSTN